LGPVGARHQRHAGAPGDFARFEFVAHHRDILGAWTDKNDVVVGTRLREGGALREKTVARMERVAAGALRSGDEVFYFQITVHRPRRADANRAIGHLRGHALSIGVRDCCDRLNSQALACANDAHGDLAAVGDQYSCDAHENSRKRKGGFETRPYKTNSMDNFREMGNRATA
jgi:hypothetical protein